MKKKTVQHEVSEALRENPIPKLKSRSYYNWK